MFRLTALAAATVLALAGCAADAGSTVPAQSPVSEAPATASPPAPASTSPAASEGGFIDYADYAQDPAAYAAGEVVLFFNATWCPTCQEATKNLEQSDFPSELTVVSVDYDSQTDLRKRYGVTTQHTFVQVSADGEEIEKFTGATTVEQIMDRLA